MDLKELFYQYNPWWLGEMPVIATIERPTVLAPLYPLLKTRDVIMLSGLRRVGKTTTIKYLIRHLIQQQKINPVLCFYISMDDYQLKSISIIDVINEYRKIMKITFQEKIFVFLDEITYANDFQIQLKNLYDKENVKCIVSSSSSSLLKDDSAYLTGRKRIIEINPLNFEEYLLFKNIHVSFADRGLLDTYFLEYLRTGGIPEYVLHGDREYLMGLVDDIITKDIIAKHGIRQPGVIKEFFILLMEHAGKQISVNKIANILKISVDSAKRYLTLFEETYLIHLMPRFGKTNEILLSTKKVYATDVGIRNAVVGFRDKGALFENIVFMTIKQHQPRYLYQDQTEIDFIFNNTLLEVKYHAELNEKQMQLFDSFPARRKVILKNYADFQKFLEHD
ncbi:MAG: AAA family ATPase [Gammaproteobacteria bacterium RIFCSPLOWO2_02_FULL_42_14]|nr:MAG: AAA family ATPase [Gammaproteobacteria bacterium RIFCSPHIGHO2_02_FULL_42_43]OGT28024.1 MAG: AAA family ATPase [Gammaproteobacteria bacterium RIFCSPHIGHO2_01_FULL_42_8]OGT53708.1 MAG: AAA family ATPase [Gammaproteobacteria bacterium RIFCSPHIGHO2_12_FULL_41_25]OGT62772.1 MAG: AAA family ATPase [Gammaproteobacteria bacterium RIFCSPLOWO2_02_FULL_42_14]OGT85623.1 MAG: AAA family ATPase [Gammaproteobacteria bacterium RIFCSPLOWO2_12_FULL_42_18]